MRGQLAAAETGNAGRSNAERAYVRCCIEAGEQGVRMVGPRASNGGR